MKHNSIKHNSHEQRNALLRVRRKLNHLQPSPAYWKDCRLNNNKENITY
jgi:hypothetical protein